MARILARTENIWIDLPIRVKCLRKRCQSSRPYVVVRPWPVAVLAADPGEAPEVLRPAPRRSDQHTLLRPVHAFDGGWYWPMQAERDRAPVDARALSAAVHAARKREQWGDWPFDVPADVMGKSDTEVIDDARLEVVRWDCDYGTETALAAAAVSRKVALIGDRLHLRIARPETLVKVEATDDRRTHAPRSVRCWMTPLDGEDGLMGRELWQGALAVQRFSPTNRAGAEAYANAYAEAHGVPVYVNQCWEPTSDATNHLGRDDTLTHLQDLARRIHEHHAGSAGHLPTHVVELWLKARDSGRAGRFDRLPHEVLELFGEVTNQADPEARRMASRLLPDLLRFTLERPDLGFELTRGGSASDWERAEGDAEIAALTL